MESKVSIIMPTYNVSAFVQETIDSVKAQSYTNWELIVIDDCSSDNTFDILERIADSDARITVLSNDFNSGAGEARNKGICASKGQYIAFLDSDDLWMPDKLLKQICFMSENNAAISHTSYSFFDEFGLKRKGYVRVSRVVDLVDNLKKTEIGTSTAVIDTAIVGRNFRFSPMRARQDIKLWIELLGKGYLSHGLDEPLVNYRVRKGSVSSNKIKMLYLTLNVYMSVKTLPFFTRLLCYFSYVSNAIRKRQK
ncbi:glycosyltransferase family 2 protein [Vibrio parahaemolyticus]|uniref:glycosyltransferase family 2 protein n=1 Tax=Vibrio parahaemolyticus TaxID=670 RepID=UPI001D1694DF|nr:glycosyltransferase family 2 protein [Vibrio parahaemolyticus]MCC3799628.1 glycosyltransferase family 2 protein [Vibrio parahaemolyticus]